MEPDWENLQDGEQSLRGVNTSKDTTPGSEDDSAKRKRKTDRRARRTKEKRARRTKGEYVDVPGLENAIVNGAKCLGFEISIHELQEQQPPRQTKDTSIKVSFWSVTHWALGDLLGIAGMIC